MKTVDVLLTGEILPGADPARAVTALTMMTGLDRAVAQALLTSGKPKPAKRCLPLDAGKALAAKLAGFGIGVALRESAGTAQTAPPPPPVPESDADEPAFRTPSLDDDADEPAFTVPRQSARVPDDAEMDAAEADDPVTAAARRAAAAAEAERGGRAGGRSGRGPRRRTAAEMVEAPPSISPYATARAADEDGMEADQGLWREEAAAQPAGQGIQWIRDAWHLFVWRPANWIGALLLFGLCLLLFALPTPAPFAKLVPFCLWPLFGGGFALMAHHQSRGEHFKVSELFSGIRLNFGALAGLCLLSVLYWAIVAGLAWYLLGSGRFFTFTGARGLDVLARHGALPGLTLLGTLVLLAPTMLINLLAPPLVMLAGDETMSALGKSLAAGFRNFGALTLNALALGGAAAYYGIWALGAWVFILAVYFTSKLM